MNKKGFTLIELLAIIIILAIIVLITSPIILNMVDKAKSGAMLDSARGIKKALDNYYFGYDVDEEDFNGYTCIFPNDCDAIKIDGEIPSGGQIVMDNKGNISGIIGYDNNYFFEFRNDNVYVYDDSLYIGTEYNFDFISDTRQFKTVYPGYYKLEVWGAQGGDLVSRSQFGGYGGYSTGIVKLDQDEKLYVVVGGQGDGLESQKMFVAVAGGYNGGGYAYQRIEPYVAGGGGATHISFKDGLLSELKDDVNQILIVAGGGSGAYSYVGGSWNGNSGGGKIGGYLNNISLAGNQERGYAFGQASDTATVYDTNSNHAGGGGGFYGGFFYWDGEAGGGSGYIGNSLLKDKAMYCYRCDESSDVDTLTYSIEEFDSEPISGVAKVGDGYARITYLGLKR